MYRFFLLRQPDLAHAALADQRDQSVHADLLPFERRAQGPLNRRFFEELLVLCGTLLLQKFLQQTCQVWSLNAKRF